MLTKKLFLTLVLCLGINICFAASRFWVGGTGTADGVTLTHISSTSGGASGASYPTTGDTFTFDGNSGGGTVTIAVDMNLANFVWGAFTGTIDFSVNNNNLTISNQFSGTGTAVRIIHMGNGTLSLSGASGTLLTIATITNLTFDAGGSTIKITNSGAGVKTLATGLLTYNNLWYTGGTGSLVIGTTAGTTTFNNIKFDPVSTVQVFAGKPIVATSITWSGTAGNINTISSTVAGTAFSLSLPATTSQDYISLKDCKGTGYPFLYAGAHSTNVSGNLGWIFQPPGQSGNGLMAF